MLARYLLAILSLFLTPMSLLGAFDSPKTFEENSSEIKILVFLSKSCPCSKSHVQHLNEIASSNKNTSVFGVITDPEGSGHQIDIDKYYSQKTFQFPVISDPEQVLVKRYQALKTPHSLILKRNKQGEYERVYQGGVTNKRQFDRATQFYLAENLAQIQQGRDVKYKQGRSLGCYIRRL